MFAPRAALWGLDLDERNRPASGNRIEPASPRPAAEKKRDEGGGHALAVWPYGRELINYAVPFFGEEMACLLSRQRPRNQLRLRLLCTLGRGDLAIHSDGGCRLLRTNLQVRRAAAHQGHACENYRHAADDPGRDLLIVDEPTGENGNERI